MSRPVLIALAVAAVAVVLLWAAHGPGSVSVPLPVPSGAKPALKPTVPPAAPPSLSAPGSPSQSAPQDPFRAFMEKGGPVVLTPSAPLPPGTDPFREALKRSESPASGVSPFGAARP